MARRHLPLTMMAEPETDLGRARAAPEQLRSLGQPLDALSFPHGRYDAASLAAARAAGLPARQSVRSCSNLVGNIYIDPEGHLLSY